MATMIQTAINEIRYYRRMCKRGIDNPLRYSNLIEKYWQDIQLYRSDKVIDVYCAKGLFDIDVIYHNMDDIELFASDADLEIGIDIIVQSIKMTGRAMGRLEFFDD